MQKVRFFLGEEKHIRLMVHSTRNDPFSIRNATWELSWAGRVEASGTCEVDDHILDAIICPKKATVYQLAITYRIADETLIEKIEVVVM